MLTDEMIFFTIVSGDPRNNCRMHDLRQLLGRKEDSGFVLLLFGGTSLFIEIWFFKTEKMKWGTYCFRF